MILDAALHVDGVVEGTIESSSDVSIGAAGSFEGTLRAHHVVVSGHLHGNVDCVRLEIVANGKVFGEINIQEIVIEPGGKFIGESRIRDQAPVPALRHQVDAEDIETVEDSTADLQKV